MTKKSGFGGFRPAETHAPTFSRKMLLPPSNAKKFRCAAPIRGPRAYGPDLGPPFRTDPPVGLEGSLPTRGSRCVTGTRCHWQLEGGLGRRRSRGPRLACSPVELVALFRAVGGA